MGSSTPLLDVLATHLPVAISSAELLALSSQSRSIVETLLSFALGGDCPTPLPGASQEWSRTQPAALKALHDCLATKGGKRTRDSQDTDDTNESKRQKTVQDDIDDPPLFTLPAISTTSPVRKKVDVTVHARSIRFTNPTTHVLESSIPLASITRTFLLPTRGKTKGHWTVVLLPADVPDRSKASPSSVQQVIFGLDALSAAKFETTSFSSGTSTPNSTTTVAKGEETATSVRKFLSHIPVPLLEPSAIVFRSACATAKSGEGAAGIDAYLSAKSGTLWFFDTGILWGESKPCEFWAISDLPAKDGIRLISATGRTCTVILSRKSGESGGVGIVDGDGDAEVVETEFSMVDGREQDPIHAWARNRKHRFGKSLAVSSPSVLTSSSPTISGSKEERRYHLSKNVSVNGLAWCDSDSDDEFEVASSEDLEHSTTDSDSDGCEGGAGTGDENASQSEGGRESGDESSEEEEEELQEAHHPLLRPGAMPRMSKAAIDMVVDMVHGDLADDAGDEEDELEE
ncbi:hypothetical protein J3R82DRAFT_9061 [Butyriboletus roseoflavus]|nr:hypothetical protein J3R82DRAFT_9061 [Butyriboletus roseoflavus]